MRRTLVPVLFLALQPLGISQANVGIYYGSGHTLKLTSTSKVQLVSEAVTIETTPHVQPPLMLGSVHYRGQYTLKNISSEPVTMNVGFPIDSPMTSGQVANLSTPAQLTSFIVDLGFIVRDESQTYHVQVARDGWIPIRYVLHWKMKLKPDETRTLHIRYQLPLSFTLASTRRDEDEDRESMSALERLLECAFQVFFAYVTETGSSWAGPIESARFSVEFKDLKESLSRKTFTELSGEPPKEEERKPFWSRRPRLFVKVSPEGVVSRCDDAAEWYFTPYKPGEPIVVRLWLTWIPNHPAHLQRFIKALYETSKPAREDLVKLKEVLLCSLGKPAQTKNVAAIVNRYVWYEPKKDFDEKLLSKSQREMLRLLDEMIAEAK